MATDSAPGSACSSASAAAVRVSTCSACGYFSGTSRTEAHTVLSASKPGLIVIDLPMFRTKSTPMVSRTTETAS